MIVVDEPGGAAPAEARNLGAARARGDLLLFVDADVVVHTDALERLRARLAADSGLAGVFGAYDDDPAAPGAVSRFRNLLHHHVHDPAQARRARSGQASGRSGARPSRWLEAS